jgi:hypothetical protein
MRKHTLASPLFAALLSATATAAVLGGITGAHAQAQGGQAGQGAAAGQQLCPEGNCQRQGGGASTGAGRQSGQQRMAPSTEAGQQAGASGAEQPTVKGRKKTGETAQGAEQPDGSATTGSGQATTARPAAKQDNEQAGASEQQGIGKRLKPAEQASRPSSEKGAAQTGSTASGEQAGGGQKPKLREQAQRTQQGDIGPAKTGSINITSEQQTTIRKTIVEEHVKPVAHLDVDVRVGVKVPRTVTFHRLPPEIVKVVPQYEGYEFFVLADGTIVIVDPNSLAIVYVMTA